MAKYLVKEKSFINDVIVEAGQIIDYTPPEGVTVSSNLELVKGKKAQQAAPDPEAPEAKEPDPPAA